MLKKLLIIPTSLILLTSFKVNSYQTSSGYKRLSNISAQYSISDTCNYVAISDFSIYSYKIKKRESIRFYVSQMPAYKNVYIDIRLFDQEGNSKGVYEYWHKKSDDSTYSWVNLTINPDNLSGLIHGKCMITIPVYGVYSSCFGEFDLYFSGSTIQKEMDELSFFCPYVANISQYKRKTTLYGEYYSLKNISNNIEIDEYGKFSFNDFNVQFYREYYQDDIYFKGNIYLYHEYDFFLGGNKFYSNKKLLKLARENDDKSTVDVKNRNKFYLNTNSNYMSSSSFNGSIETYDFYFPIEDYVTFKETTFTLFFAEWGYCDLSLHIPIKVKFVKDTYIDTYEIIGEIGGNIDNEDYEEINL